MNILKLKVELENLKIPKDWYSLKGCLPNEAMCIANKNNKWEVYYSERGRKSGLKIFENESDACIYFLDIMKRIKETFI